MGHFRISGAADARRVEHEDPARDPRKVGDLAKHPKTPALHHYGKHTGLDSAPGGSFEVQLPEFNAVVQGLAQQCDQFMKALDDANGLAAQLPDGSGPIASVVGEAFNHRLGADGGMRYALRTHVEHLSKIVSSLQQMAATYQDGEDQVSSAMAAVAQQMGGTA
ncbi:MAG TPA: hypothetical protein VHX38_26570 [Pseudonocardiaceae bacterium]|jgi:hypothetical protein|nr:hypothetical protein [Pseudonocardiaceae bacterium]